MVNPILLEILKRKIDSGEITIDQVKLQEYKDALLV
jgi:hypothetical protein